VAKVKKGARVTSVRNSTGARKVVSKKGKTAAKKPRVSAKPRAKVAAKVAAKVKAKPLPEVRFTIKELDPFAKCGPDSSVQFLYRVDEHVEGKRTPHLVFFDHHGWYCEHGRGCPAVAPARKHNGHIARVS